MSADQFEVREPQPALFRPRPAQARILEYSGGYLGISAVPGSGKTFILSLLAARLVERMAASGGMDEREVLVVTFTNSAVENFRRRINQFVQLEQGLLPGVGYRVRTLHGLAHDIVRERPALVGLSEEFEIIDERTAADIKREATVAYLQNHPETFAPYLLPEYLQNPRRIERYLVDDAIEIAEAVIRVAKDLRARPAQLQATLARQAGTWPLLEFGLQVYADYERSLSVRGAVDFDDLILLALQALETDQGYLARLQQRWPYVLEDEAQDSSRLQQELLGMLTATHGNWVRVGDPNQAINTTFTSADPNFLRRFVDRKDVQELLLPNSGRSVQPIIDLANYLAHWSRTAHPLLPPESALSAPDIQPTPPGDPQPNPEVEGPAVYLFERPLTGQEEVDVVLRSLRRWLPQNPDRTAAVLVPENHRGFQIAEALKGAGLPFDDSLLRSDSSTRAAAQALSTVLRYIAQPQVPTHLQRLWSEVWWSRRGSGQVSTPADGDAKGGDGTGGQAPASSPMQLTDTVSLATNSGQPTLPEPVETFGRALSKATQPERFLFPVPGDDWLDGVGWLDEVEGFREVVEAFRTDLRRWTAATVLPVDELVLTLGNDLFTEPADLALAHRIAVLLARLAQENPAWRLPELAGELENVAQNRRRILGFSEDGLGFEPPPGRVTVATMHSAKGLEWDRVYLLAVNSYSFPSGADDEQYRGQRWFVRDSLNLTAEAIEQLRQLHMGTLDEYVEGEASRQARRDVAAERLRLFYVGITRARRELIVTYNTGRSPERDPLSPALAFQALLSFTQNHPGSQDARR